MNELNHKIKKELQDLGADIVGFGSLAELPENVRERLPVGISVAIAHPKDVICGIRNLPTQEYREWVEKLNKRLDAIVIKGAALLTQMGYRAIAQSREYIDSGRTEYSSNLPHKTVATRAGIGWIGKCALLITSEYGSAVRISSILTDAPLETAPPVNESYCGDCMICTNACPAGALSGKLWNTEIYRDEFYDPVKCKITALERTMKGFGEAMTICGKCIEICPHTQRYINGASVIKETG